MHLHFYLLACVLLERLHFGEQWVEVLLVATLSSGSIKDSHPNETDPLELAGPREGEDRSG